MFDDPSNIRYKTFSSKTRIKKNSGISLILIIMSSNKMRIKRKILTSHLY